MSAPVSPIPTLGAASKMNGVDSDNIQMMRALEEGLMLTRFYFKKKPEKKMFQVKLETRELAWFRALGQKQEGVGQCLFLL